MSKVIFIHRSVGQNLLDDGDLANLVRSEAERVNKEVDFKDINNNVQKGVPGDDTKPTDYAKYFSENSRAEDLIVIKSCYPTNAIKSDQTLEDLKDTYREIVSGFSKRSKGDLLILTTPPLRPVRTNPAEAARARKLANWLKANLPNKRVHVFDFYDLLAASPNGKQANMLKSEYRRLLPWDNHPSKSASRHIAPILAKKIANRCT